VQPDEDGNLNLTDYARAYMDECCLIFDMKITSKVGFGCHLNPLKNPDDQWIQEALNIKYSDSLRNIRRNLAPYGVEIYNFFWQKTDMACPI